MLVDDGALAEAAGAAGRDERLAQHVQHGRACDARDERRLHDAQRERGQRERAQRAEPAGLERHVAGHGKPAQPHREDQDQQQAEEKVRDRDADERARHQRLVGRPIVVTRRHHAGRHAERDGDQGRVEGQQDRRLGAIHDRLQHRTAQEDRLAEVAPRQPPVPAEELDVKGRVEAQLALDARDVVRARVGAGDDRGRIAGGEVDQHEGDGGDDEDDGNERQQAPRDVRLHAPGVTSTARRSRRPSRRWDGSRAAPCASPRA